MKKNEKKFLIVRLKKILLKEIFYSETEKILKLITYNHLGIKLYTIEYIYDNEILYKEITKPENGSENIVYYEYDTNGKLVFIKRSYGSQVHVIEENIISNNKSIIYLFNFAGDITESRVEEFDEKTNLLKSQLLNYYQAASSNNSSDNTKDSKVSKNNLANEIITSQKIEFEYNQLNLESKVVAINKNGIVFYESNSEYDSYGRLILKLEKDFSMNPFPVIRTLITYDSYGNRIQETKTSNKQIIESRIRIFDNFNNIIEENLYKTGYFDAITGIGSPPVEEYYKNEIEYW